MVSQANVGNWTAEGCATVGIGDLLLVSPIADQPTFLDTIPAGKVWYSILDGTSREAGEGDYDGANTISRTKVDATFVGGVYSDSSPSPISLSGESTVTCTFNSAAYRDLISSIETNAADIATNAFDIAANASDVSGKVNRSGDTMTGQLKGITPIAASDLTRKDYVDAQIGSNWSDYLDGYLDTGLHENYGGDLNTILVNSTYSVTTNITNGPPDFTIGFAFVETIMFTSNLNCTQFMYGMNTGNFYKIWMRHKINNIWEAWVLVVDGVAQTMLRTGSRLDITNVPVP